VEYRPARWTPDSGYDRAEQVPDVYMLDWEKVMEWQEGENMRRELRAQWEELPQQDRRRVSYTDWCAGAR